MFVSIDSSLSSNSYTQWLCINFWTVLKVFVNVSVMWSVTLVQLSA